MTDPRNPTTSRTRKRRPALDTAGNAPAARPGLTRIARPLTLAAQVEQILGFANDTLQHLDGDLSLEEDTSPDSTRAFDLRVRRAGGEPIGVAFLSGSQQFRVDAYVYAMLDHEWQSMHPGLAALVAFVEGIVTGEVHITKGLHGAINAPRENFSRAGLRPPVESPAGEAR